MIRLKDTQEVGSYSPAADFAGIEKAYVYGSKFHEGQVRKNGDPYLVHPLEVAHILAQLKLDEASIEAGILHDTIEDTLATKAQLGICTRGLILKPKEESEVVANGLVLVPHPFGPATHPSVPRSD